MDVLRVVWQPCCTVGAAMEATMAERLYDGARVMVATGDAMAAARHRARDLAQGAANLRAASANLAIATSQLASAQSRLAKARAMKATSTERLARS